MRIALAVVVVLALAVAPVARSAPPRGDDVPHLQLLDALLPVPTASDRLDLFDPVHDRLLTFIGYDQPPGPRTEARFPNELWSVPLDRGVLAKASAETAPPADLPFGSYWGRAALTRDGRYLYLTGPFDTLSVLVADLDESGRVGSWQSTTTLPTTPTQRRSLHQILVDGDHLLVLGGWFQDGQPAMRDIHVAPLSSDGGVGAFRLLEISLPIDGGGFSISRCNGYLFVARGTEVWSSQMLDEGELAPFTLAVRDNTIDHASYGQTAMACSDTHLVLVDVQQTHLFELGPDGALRALAHLEHPATFPQREHGPVYPSRSVFVREGGFVITTSNGGRVYKLDP